ncbi:MAG TPA: sialidase family protein [Candidatus Thermoplasmatota archaeon]|jgi:hypothetical protein|nr:sialidase family protein [Candidatus Thermoplasmatota archaeon]
MARAPALLPLLALIALALAGCTQPAVEQPALLPPLPAVPKLGFSEAMALPEGDNNGEPNLAVDMANRIIYGCAPGGSKLWISLDGGATFNVTSPQMAAGPAGVPHLGGGDCDIAVDPAGAVYYADLWLGSTSVAVTTDQGATWFDHPAASATVANDRQWLATTTAGTAFLAYNQLATGPWVSRTTDGGRTWVPFPLFASAIDPMGYKTQLDFLFMGNIKADAQGLLYVAWVAGNALAPNTLPAYPYVNALMVSTSADQGQTWAHHAVTTSDTSLGYLIPALAIDAAGTPYVVWSQPNGEGFDVFVASSPDHGATWGAPVAVSEPGGSSVMPWVAAGAPGHVAIVWYGSNETADPNEVQGAWFVHIAQLDGADTASPTFTRGLVSPMSNHQGPICTYGILCNGGRDLLDYFQVALDWDGLPHVIWSSDADRPSTQILYARGILGDATNAATS